MAPRTRYAMVVTTAVVGAGAIALGAGAALPTPDSIPDTTASLNKVNSLSAGDGAGIEASTRQTLVDTRASRAQRRAGTPIPQTIPEWVRPCQGPLSSLFAVRWGVPHKGVDLACPYGTVVHAAAAGVVKFADWNGGYGRLVIVDHGNGVTTRYGHNSKFLVKAGQRVEAGDPLSEVGSTGFSTGPHCHFEVRLGEEAINPLPWMKARGVDLSTNVDLTR
jgi:murein DD-endopeptidase MepM/ murein hydrolase activator NlpD